MAEATDGWVATTVETIPMADHFLAGRTAARGRAGGGLRQVGWPDGDAGGGQRRLGLGHRVLAEVEDRRRQHGVGAAVHHALDEVVERADATAGDHRHGHRVGDGPVSTQVEAVAGAVAVHRREQDLAGAELVGLARPTPRRRRPVGVRPPCTNDLPAAVAGARLGVDGAHHALRAELGGDLGDQPGRSTALVLTLTLSAPARSSRRASSTRADAAADGEGDEDLLGGATGDVDHRVAAVGRRGDVEEHELVGALGVVAGRQLDRVAGVAQVDEVDALHHPAGGRRRGTG